MTIKSETSILPSDLEVGDVIRYKSSSRRYLVSEIISLRGSQSITLVKVEEKGGEKQFFRNPGTDVINELKANGSPSSHWTQPVILLDKGHEVPSPNQIMVG